MFPHKEVSAYYCLLDRIKPWAEEILGDNRLDSDKTVPPLIKYSSYDNYLLQKMWEYDRGVHMLFVDFRKAYDSIHWESLINILKEFKMYSI